MITEEKSRGFRLCICRECFNYYLQRPACEGRDILYEAYGKLKDSEEVSLKVTSPAEERYRYDASNAYEAEHILTLTAQRFRRSRNGNEVITRLHFRRGDAYEKTAVTDRDCPYCGSDLRQYVSEKDRHTEEAVIRASDMYRKAVQKQYDSRKETSTEPDTALRTAYAYRDDVRSGLAEKWAAYMITEDPAFCPYRQDQEE
ncbi:MAG: hypothetical protein IKG46_10955 [Solobacterium sp.]|nr:hypothetical protein [Solobacterium sp.]